MNWKPEIYKDCIIQIYDGKGLECIIQYHGETIQIIRHCTDLADLLQRAQLIINNFDRDRHNENLSERAKTYCNQYSFGIPLENVICEKRGTDYYVRSVSTKGTIGESTEYALWFAALRAAEQISNSEDRKTTPKGKRKGIPWTLEAKQAVRRKNLRRCAEKKVPLWSENFIQEEYRKNPEYYGVKEDFWQRFPKPLPKDKS